jgi:TetR/AcrR family transcriptional regulator, cholesterol catabolism regulator
MRRVGQRKALQSSIKKTWILDKAETLFWQKGYLGTSMIDIAKACNCRPANIYNYFKNKEDILYEVIRDMTNQMLSKIQPLGEDNTTCPVDLLKSFIKTHFGFLVNMRKSIVSITDTGLKDLTPDHREEIIKLRKTYDEILRKILIRGRESGHFSEIDEQVISYLIPSLIIRSNIWYSPKGRLSAEEVGNMMFRFVYEGIRSRSGNPSQDCVNCQAI